jgi:hypothetical protein
METKPIMVQDAKPTIPPVVPFNSNVPASHKRDPAVQTPPFCVIMLDGTVISNVTVPSLLTLVMVAPNSPVGVSFALPIWHVGTVGSIWYVLKYVVTVSPPRHVPVKNAQPRGFFENAKYVGDLGWSIAAE